MVIIWDKNNGSENSKEGVSMSKPSRKDYCGD